MPKISVELEEPTLRGLVSRLRRFAAMVEKGIDRHEVIEEQTQSRFSISKSDSEKLEKLNEINF